MSKIEFIKFFLICITVLVGFGCGFLFGRAFERDRRSKP